MYLMFQNDGELDVNGLRLMGASTKRDQAKIGFFGTGNKYALAVLLRAGAQVVIFSGERRVAVEVRDASMRGQQFQEILIDGAATGLTTSMGPKWEVWMAVREFLCNSLDEGGSVVAEQAAPIGQQGKTRILVSLDVLHPVRLNWDRYFRLNAKPGLLPKVDSKTRVYRRGILIHESDSVSSFDYECPSVPITEDRNARGPDVMMHVMAAVDEARPEDKRRILKEMHPFESGLPMWHFHPSESWADLLKDEVVCTASEKAFWRDDPIAKSALVLPDPWVSMLKKLPSIDTLDKMHVRKSVGVEEQRASHPIRRKSKAGAELRRALAILKKVGVEIADDHVILVKEFKDPWVRGKWDGEYIYVKSDLPFQDLVGVLVHEWLHERTGADDHERRFENAMNELLAEMIVRAAR